MNLIIHKRPLVISRARTTPTLSVNRNGHFLINGFLSQIIGLKEGGRVLLAQNKDRPTDWYISKTIDADGYELKSNTNKTNTTSRTGLKFSCVPKARFFMDSIGLKEERATTMLVSTDPVNYNGMLFYPIITRSAIRKDTK